MRYEEAIKILGVSYKTLGRYVKKGYIRTSYYELPKYKSRTKNYWDEDVYAMVGRKVKERGHKVVSYIRINNRTTESLARLAKQKESIHMFATARGIDIDDVYEDIGHGTDFSKAGRPEFHRLLQDIMKDDIDMVIIETKDRLMRVGIEILEALFKYYQCELLIINKHLGDTYYESEQSADLARLLASAKIDRIGSD